MIYVTMLTKHQKYWTFFVASVKKILDILCDKCQMRNPSSYRRRSPKNYTKSYFKELMIKFALSIQSFQIYVVHKDMNPIK